MERLREDQTDRLSARLSARLTLGVSARVSARVTVRVSELEWLWELVQEWLCE